MATTVNSLHALAGKSSSTTEVAELQLAGCVLVAVLLRTGMFESRGVQDVLTKLMHLLKLPSTHPAFVQEWCTKFQTCFTTNRFVCHFQSIYNVHGFNILLVRSLLTALTQVLCGV